MSFGEWLYDAACAGKPTVWFFAEREGRGDKDHYSRGREVCAGCPVAADCLRDALETNEGYGLRGGLTPQERGTYKRRARLRKAAS